MPSQGITFPMVHHESTEAAEILVYSGRAASHRAAEVDILTWCHFCKIEEFKSYGSWRLVPWSQIKTDEAWQCVMNKINYKEFSKFST